MQNHKGQALPKFRATKEVHALKIESVETIGDKHTIKFVGGYHAPLEIGVDQLAFGGIGETTKPNHYVVWDEDQGDEPRIVPAERFDQFFKPVT